VLVLVHARWLVAQLQGGGSTAYFGNVLPRLQENGSWPSAEVLQSATDGPHVVCGVHDDASAAAAYPCTQSGGCGFSVV
jgi:hypothetical protein